MKHVQAFEKFNESVDPLEKLMAEIRAVLTPDLLKGMWTSPDSKAHPTAGHCYAATSSLWVMLGGMDSGYTPYVLSQRNYPELLGAGESHWYLMNRTGKVLDVTVDQFEGYPIDYSRGIANGMMAHPAGGSKRTRTIINRVLAMRD